MRARTTVTTAPTARSRPLSKSKSLSASDKRGSPCAAFEIALPRRTKPTPVHSPRGFESFGYKDTGSRNADTGLPNDFFAPFSDDFAQRAGPVDLPARLHRLPGNAWTIVGNDSIANHPEAAHLELGRKLSGSHVGRE
jgi:hypothetical protein